MALIDRSKISQLFGRRSRFIVMDEPDYAAIAKYSRPSKSAQAVRTALRPELRPDPSVAAPSSERAPMVQASSEPRRREEDGGDGRHGQSRLTNFAGRVRGGRVAMAHAIERRLGQLMRRPSPDAAPPSAYSHAAPAERAAASAEPFPTAVGEAGIGNPLGHAAPAGVEQAARRSDERAESCASIGSPSEERTLASRAETTLQRSPEAAPAQAPAGHGSVEAQGPRETRREAEPGSSERGPAEGLARPVAHDAPLQAEALARRGPRTVDGDSDSSPPPRKQWPVQARFDDPARTDAEMEDQEHKPAGEAAVADAGSNGLIVDADGSNIVTITRDSRFAGRLAFLGTVVVEGEVEGDVDASRVFVRQSGSVKAKVSCDSLVVEGCVRGDVLARSDLEVAASGSVLGDVSAAQLNIHRGARLKGRCSIGHHGD